MSQREREPRRLPRFHDEPWRWPIARPDHPPAACTELAAWLTPYGSYSRGLLTRDRGWSPIDAFGSAKASEMRFAASA